jgi:RNA ligase
VVKLAQHYLSQPENAHIQAFATKLASDGYTLIFELTHPAARIVVAQEAAQLQLLHIRHNHSGAYVLLDPAHKVHELIRAYQVPMVRRFEALSLAELLASLETMQDQEGYVVQFSNGDMVKLKCPWYLRLHRSICFLRERDIALLALNEQLDDVKAALRKAGVDLSAVNAVESRLKTTLLGYEAEIERITLADQALERKNFAIKHKNHPLFGLIMMRYVGKEFSLAQWYGRTHLKQDFTLRVLANGALAEAMTG